MRVHLISSLARLVPLLACAGVLSSASPAAAQDPAPAPAPGESPPDPAPAPAPSPTAAPPPAEATPEAVPAAPAEDADFMELVGTEEVVVSGFRSSLGAALDRKQNSTAQVDAIVAEDIADFPDLNLAESLQRIPGVAITRANGEGSQITVRGLGGLYTRVRVNGMEARSSTGTNAGRNFDFSLFASELFNSIIVHKTATAELDEGSLGAVVDLNTARAFNYDKGFTFVAGAQAAYNDLSDTVRPRLTGLVAYRDPEGLWGATASVAYSRVRTDSVYTDTVSWQKAAFRSVNGISCVDFPEDPGCLEVADAFHPRIPRYGQDIYRGHRIGLTAGVQFRPTDSTELRMDALYADYTTRNDQRRLFLLFRGNEGTMDISDYTLEVFPERFGAGNNSLVAATVNNGWTRNEHVRLDQPSRFYQVTLGLDHRFTDNFYLDALAGTSRSRSGQPHDTTVNYDIRGYNGYRFDFRDDKYPLLAYEGDDVNDPANFIVSELRDRVGKIKGGFDTAELNLHYDFMEELKLDAGVHYKRAQLDSRQSNRDGTICGFMIYECDTNGDDVDDIMGPPGQADRSLFLEYPAKVGAGSTRRWASPGIDNWANAFGYYDVPTVLAQPLTNKVFENNLGYYLQARGEIPFGEGEMRLAYDGGLRYVETRQSSSGYASGFYVTRERPTYRDVLPAVNAALWVTNEWVVRAAAAKVMARPALGDLSPGGTVDGFGYQINFQNPRLDPTRATALDGATEWYFADDSVLSLAVFYKDIDSFPIRQSRRGTFASTMLPRNVIQPTTPADLSGPEGEGTCGQPEGCWDISELTEGPGATLKGFEVGFQAPFNAFYGGLPPVIRGMGIVANYTYVDSEANYDFLGNPIKERLVGLSNGQYNATLYYEDTIFSARVSLAYRSDYLTGGPNVNNNLWQFTDADTRLDFSSSYNINENLKVSLEALNLTDSPLSTKVDIDADRRLVYTKTGRTYLLGARFSY